MRSKHDTPKSSRSPSSDKGETVRQSRLTWLIPLGLLAVLVLLYFLWPAFRDFADTAYSKLISGDQRAIEAWVRGYGLWGPAVILLAMVAQAILVFVPSVLLMVVSVVAYGPIWGSLLAWLGLMLAAAIAYGIGRALGPVTVDRLLGPEVEQRLRRQVERYGVWAVAAARVSPILSTDAVSYAAGLVGMGMYRFLLATGLGILPLALPIAILGRDLGRLTWVLVAISLLSLAAVIVYARYERRKNARDEPTPTNASDGRKSEGV